MDTLQAVLAVEQEGSSLELEYFFSEALAEGTPARSRPATERP